MPSKQSNSNSRKNSFDKVVDEEASLEALKARVGAAVNIFTLLFVIIAILAPSSVYIYELMYSEDPPTVWWLDPAIEEELKQDSIPVSLGDKSSLSTRMVSSDTEWAKSYLRISRRWSTGTYCGSDRSLSRHTTGNSSSTKHRKSAASFSTGFIFDATYTDYRAYVSILLKDNTQSLCETRAAIADSATSSSTTSPHNEALYTNRTWLHVPKVYPKAFICRFYDHKSKLVASSSSQSVIAGYYVRCPVPTAVRARHKLLMRLQWFEDAPIAVDASKTRHMRASNQSSLTSTISSGSSSSIGSGNKKEPKMTQHFSHLFPVCSFLSAEYHSGQTSATAGTSEGGLLSIDGRS